MTTTTEPGDEPAVADVARLRLWARVVLVPVALIGAALSFASIYEAARPTYGPVLAAGFPFLVDFLILGVSLQYIAGARVGRPRFGWRLTAHAGVAGTLLLNALAARDLAHLPWHVVAPAVWSVLVEMSAREVIGEYRATRRAPADRIPARLWFTAPVESTRTWLLMARSGSRSHAVARVDVGVMAAAGEALRLALPGRRPRRVRRIIKRQLRAGSLPPAQVLASLGWTDSSSTLVTDPAAVLRATLTGVLAPGLREPAPAPTLLAAAPVLTPAVTAPVVGVAEAAQAVAASPAEPATVAEPSVAPAAEPVVAVVAAPAPVAPEAPLAAVKPAATTGGDEQLALPELVVALDAPRRPFNDPIFIAPVPVAPVPQEPDRAAFTSTGDRPSDAVALLRAEPHLSADALAERLRGLGWVLDDRVARQVHAQARHYLRGPLTAVR
jgi:hypothetical protein